MASPSYSHHLNDLIAQLFRLAEFMTATRKAVQDWPQSPTAVRPGSVLQQACWSTSDKVFTQHVDVMCRYNFQTPLLWVDGGLLTRLLADLVCLAIGCSGNRGVVACGLHYDQQGLRFCISDSSGVTGRECGWKAGSLRHDQMSRLDHEAATVGATLLVSVHEGEGVVMELLFPPELCQFVVPDISRIDTANDETLSRQNEPLRL